MKTIFHLFLFLVLTGTGSALASTIYVNCDQGATLSDALATANEGSTIQVKGLCEESITIVKDGITLEGNSRTVIVGDRQAAVTVSGAQRVTIRGFKLQGSLSGLKIAENASASLHKTTVQENVAAGILVTGGSSLAIIDTVIRDTTGIGLNVERGSEVEVTGTLNVRDSGVFGVNLAGTSTITFREANVEVTANILGIQISTGSSAFLTDANTTVDTSGNLSTGFTVNSGSTLFLFESTIISDNNQSNHGLSVSSNSNVDMDRDATITVSNNGLDGLRLENSHLNMFTMSGLKGPRLTATGNSRHGVSAFLSSTIDLTFDSQIISQQNMDVGLLADNGSAIRIINSELTDNSRDVALSFGTRAEFNANTIGTIKCDATTLIRGDTGTTCPTSD